MVLHRRRSPQEEAQQLEKGWLTLRFSRGRSRTSTPRVTYLTAPPRTASRRGGAGLPGVSGPDHPAAPSGGSAVLRSYEGLRVPQRPADERGQPAGGLLRWEARWPSFKPVCHGLPSDGYSLVQAASPSQDVRPAAGDRGIVTLRPGDEVIMTGVTLDGQSCRY